MIQKILLLALIAIFGFPAFTQTTDKKNAEEEKARLQKEAVAFLRETLSDVANMRSLENRISFSSEMAGLMWFHDEREAKSMFAAVVSDFKELLLRYDSQMNSFGLPSEGEENEYPSLLSGELSDRTRLMRKFRVALGVRQQIAASIAEHDSELAFSFYYDSLAIISNAEFRKQLENNDTFFEFNLINQIAEKDAGKASKFGAKSLDRGLNYQHIDLLRKIHAKDPDKGIEFGSAILSKVKSEKFESDKFYLLNNLLSLGTATLDASRAEGGKKAIYSQNDLRDIADVLAKEILDNDSEQGTNGLEYADDIERYLPSRALQIRAKYASRARRSNSNSLYSNRAVARALGAANTAANTYTVTSEVNYAGSGTSNSNTAAQAQIAAEEKLLNEVKNIETGELPNEEKRKIITKARKILLQTPGKDKKIAGLSLLAAQVSRTGDKELAAEIMRDAKNLVNPSPKNYQDFAFTWMLASGYAESDPEKAFPLLEETIGRANEMITAFVKVAEFIDAAEEMISDGEVQVGAFGGQMVRGLTKEIGVAETTIRTLSRVDFVKTKALTNRFDRAEVRILAKMLVLRAVLGGELKTGVESENTITAEPAQSPARKNN